MRADNSCLAVQPNQGRGLYNAAQNVLFELLTLD